MSRLPSFYALSLLFGALLVGVAGLRHPLLEGDGAAQLRAVAAAADWRAVHLALVFGLVLVAAGLVGLAVAHGGTPGAPGARAGMALAVLGYGTVLVGVVFMGGSAARLADAYHRADPGLVATEAVFVYDMLRPFAVLALRAGEFAVGLAIWAFGGALLDGRRAPRGLAWAGAVAGILCAIWAVVTDEHSPVLMAGLAPVTAWQLLTAGWMIRAEARRPASAAG